MGAEIFPAAVQEGGDRAVRLRSRRPRPPCSLRGGTYFTPCYARRKVYAMYVHALTPVSVVRDGLFLPSVYDTLLPEKPSCPRYESKLYHCSAAIYRTADASAIFLLSYETFIAVYYPETNVLHDCLRTEYHYTRASAKHIAKFARWLTENHLPVKEIIRHVPAKQAKEIDPADDYDDAEIDPIPAES